MSVQIDSEIDRAELETVLASGVFSRSPNLAKMLRYIGSKYLEGQQDSIKEYNIGVEALDRPPDFDPKRDSIVRVEAVRLREKLKRYYETEGADHAVVISLQVGRYFPQFLHRTKEHSSSANPPLLGGLLPPPRSGASPDSSFAPPQLEKPDRESATATADSAGTATNPPDRSPAGGLIWRLALALIIVAAGVAIFVVKKAARPNAGQAPPAATVVPAPLAESSGQESAAAPAESAVRILAGYSKKDYVDRSGNRWSPDRYFTGGQVRVEPQVFIARARDPVLFQTAREGDFSYNIPLKSGTYELHLYFVETEYGPGTPRGGGENSRVFSIDLNGKPLLSDFDIYSDAAGSNIADERVFKNVSPAADGKLHLSFIKVTNYPVLSALYISSNPLGKIQPIRIVAQKNPFTDAAGHVWKPDRYFMRGQLSASVNQVQGSPDPGLYAGERYGNFSYAIPVAGGRYSVTLYFAETYFGPDNLGGSGVDSRLFDVDCNGVALLRNFDVFKEAGGDNRAVVRTFPHLRPNAQGKLLLTFVPAKNYASVQAIEVTDDSP